MQSEYNKGKRMPYDLNQSKLTVMCTNWDCAAGRVYGATLATYDGGEEGEFPYAKPMDLTLRGTRKTSFLWRKNM